MHEHSLLRDIVAKLDELSSQGKITGVKIWLGAFSHISAEHFMEHFDEEAKGKAWQDCELEVEKSMEENHPQAQHIILQSVEVEDEG